MKNKVIIYLLIILINFITYSCNRKNNIFLIDAKACPSFSPDGKKILFSPYYKKTYWLLLYDLEKKSFVILNNELENCRAAQFSKDGENILFMKYNHELGTQDICLMKANDYSYYCLTEGKSFNHSPTFSVDNKKVYFIREIVEENNLRNMEVCSYNLENNKITAHFKANDIILNPVEIKDIFIFAKENIIPGYFTHYERY